MTEDEAKTKWCPFARVAASAPGKPLTVPGGQSVFNRIETDVPEEVTRYPGAAKCIASACMAWRTRRVRAVIETVYADASPGPEWDEGLLDREWERTDYQQDGFCGLAGAVR